jgi:hypothetical protein
MMDPPVTADKLLPIRHTLPADTLPVDLQDYFP